MLKALGQTEEHGCVCCSLSRVEIQAPALLGWQWALLPAWVTEGLSEGQEGTRRRKQEPQESSLWAVCPVSVCPSIQDHSQAGQAGWLLWCV